MANNLTLGERVIDAWQDFLMKNLPGKTELFNEYHALIVELGKTLCRKKPLCGKCPLQDKCQILNIKII